MPDIAENIALVQERIAAAAVSAHRSADEILLLAVSKTQPASMIAEAKTAGQRHFGENYLQDALPKILELGSSDISWHFIGRIQSNKTRDIAEHFDWVHSLASLKHARRLNEQRPERLGPLNICLQINISNDANKDGFGPGEAAEAVAQISRLPNLSLRGLMTIPAVSNDMDATQQDFHKLRLLRDQLASDRYPLGTLSMGMSGDLEAAIAEGSTIVRIGTAIFGPRKIK